MRIIISVIPSTAVEQSRSSPRCHASIDDLFPSHMGIIGVFQDGISDGFIEAAFQFQKMLGRGCAVPALIFIPTEEKSLDHVFAPQGKLLGVRSGHVVTSQMVTIPVSFKKPQPITCIAGLNDDNCHHLSLLGGTRTGVLDGTALQEVANSKWRTKQILTRAGIPCPRGKLFSRTDYVDGNVLKAEVARYVHELACDEIVVKPDSEYGGTGVSLINLGSGPTATSAIQRAVRSLISSHGSCLVEEGAKRMLLTDRCGRKFDFNFRIIGRRSNHNGGIETEIIHSTSRIGPHGTIVNAMQGAKSLNHMAPLLWAAENGLIEDPYEASRNLHMFGREVLRVLPEGVSGSDVTMCGSKEFSVLEVNWGNIGGLDREANKWSLDPLVGGKRLTGALAREYWNKFL